MSPKAIAVPVSVQSREVWRGFLFVRKRNVGWSVPGSARAALRIPQPTSCYDIFRYFAADRVRAGWRCGGLAARSARGDEALIENEVDGCGSSLFTPL
jgi:hypothetical protein